ncbi:MAG: hypothetical protein SVV80_02240 [Planctomycetota bacterium]|nr:hypothetical protein [Planctomycetota bacterium]
MTQNPYAPPPVVPQAEYEYVVEQKPPVWHKVIGIISIVFGSLGIVCTPISLGANAANPTHKEAMKMFPDWWQSYTVFSSFLGIAFAILLLVAGISLLRRRPAGRPLHLIYAGVTIIMAVVGIVAMVSMINTDSIPVEMRTVIITSAVFGILFGSAYPVFLLIWFLRPGIRNEVASWPRTQAQSPAGGLPLQ